MSFSIIFGFATGWYLRETIKTGNPSDAVIMVTCFGLMVLSFSAGV